MGALIDDSVDPRDITSIMVDLAVRGYLKITEIQHKGLLFSSKDYQLDLLKPREQSGPMRRQIRTCHAGTDLYRWRKSYAVI